MLHRKGSNMTRVIQTLVIAGFAIASLISAVNAQQTSNAPGGGRKHPEQKTDAAAASTAPKADEKAYNAALKSLPNKPYDPWSGTR
jgi:hypothetical protein